MKKLNDFTCLMLPPFILVLLAILWKVTDFVGIAVLCIVFWMGWRQLVKKYKIN